MWTTFDRYLLSRYLFVVVTFFIAALGLYAVVDGFTRLDEFQEAAADAGLSTLVKLIAEHYLYQSALIVDLAGPTIMVFSAMSTLALLLKQGEIHPVLAAGVPTYRWSRPLVLGVLGINALLIANQELILPRVAPYLQVRHGKTVHDLQPVQPRYDSRQIFISGRGLLPVEKKISKPEFRIPFPTLARDNLVLKAEEAIFVPRTESRPSGWLIHQPSPPPQELTLTDESRKVIMPTKNGQDLFIVSSLAIDQLNEQASNHRFVGTPALIRRLKQSPGSLLSRRSIIVHLHCRLTRPLLTLIGLYLVIPLIVRRERMNNMQQVTNIAVCVAALGVVFGLAMASQFLGTSGIVKEHQAVWAPLVFGGSLAGWLTGTVRT